MNQRWNTWAIHKSRRKILSCTNDPRVLELWFNSCHFIPWSWSFADSGWMLLWEPTGPVSSSRSLHHKKRSGVLFLPKLSWFQVAVQSSRWTLYPRWPRWLTWWSLHLESGAFIERLARQCAVAQQAVINGFTRGIDVERWRHPLSKGQKDPKGRKKTIFTVNKTIKRIQCNSPKLRFNKWDFVWDYECGKTRCSILTWVSFLHARVQ